MNKKRLSVVMAGAMLASAVAPVMAADVTAQTMPADQRGLVMEGIRNLMKSKMLDGTTDVEDDSAYGFTIVAKGESDKDSTGKIKVDLHNKLSDLKIIKDLKDNDEKTIRVYEKETRVNEYGKLTDKYAKDSQKPGSEKVATEADLNALLGDSNSGLYISNKFVDKVEAIDGKVSNGVKITLNVSKDATAGSTEKKEIVLKAGDKLLDLTKPMDKDNHLLDYTKDEDVQKFDYFDVVKVGGGTATVTEELPGRTLVQEINLVKAADATDAFKVEDLFDGLMLTEKGTELFETYKYDEKNEGLDYTYELQKGLLPGIYGFNIKVTDAENNQKLVKTITVRGLNKDNFDILNSWFVKREFNVGVLAGDNRYETAVKISKEQAKLAGVEGSKNAIGHIVLVNGEALVDGLAAAPLAQKLGKNGNAAPILLTKSNTIPKETLAYLKELVKTNTIAGLENIQVNIVGGEAVVSKDVVDTLKGLGFKVVRHGGDNREETSLEVMENLKDRKTVYVVGAEGEADAMSIAPVAATSGSIVVAKKGGLSKAAYKEIERSKANVVIIGGEAAVSKEEESKLKEIAKENKTSVERVAGKNRQATNAAIIEKYYNLTKTTNLVVAKDGQNNKMELVDALTAANLASQKKAPVVLATNKLSDDQLNEINKKAANAEALYQVGYGVNRTVVTKLAELLGLPKVIK